MTWHPLDSEFHQRMRDPEAVRKELEEKRRREIQDLTKRLMRTLKMSSEREAYLRLPEQQRRLVCGDL